jgi:enoyl-CoA hydratase
MRPPSTLRYTEEGDVARITLVRELTDMAMVRELTEICDHLEDNSPAKVVVIRGAGPHFCRGIDFLAFRPDQAMDIHGFNKWEKLISRVERLPKATIAALHGDVIGGGLQLALACDLRVAAPDTRVQLNELHLGFLPGMATFRLAKYIGMGRAKRMIMTAQQMGAAEALSIGLVDAVGEDLEASVAAQVEALGPKHTVAIELARRLLNESFETSFEDGIGNFLAAQHRAITQTAFIETLKKAHKGGT